MKNNRWLSLMILCTGFLLIVVDMTIVNVALPSIQRDLRFSQSGLAWVINAYLIAFGGFLLLAGRLGDLFGRKRVYLIGLGIFSFIASAGAAIGLLAGGLITQAVSWHWIFFVNVPIGIVTAALSFRLLASDRGIGIEKGVDVIGAVLVTVALMLGVYTIVQSSDYGLGSVRTLGFGALAVGLLAAFVVRQAMATTPILPLRIFASRKLTAANGVQALMSSAFLGFFFVASLDLQRVMGYGPMAIGLAFLPVAVVMGLFSVRFSALLINRFGPLTVLVSGQMVIVVALTMLGFGPANANYAIHVLVPLALLGLGGGLSFPSLTIIAMADAQPSDAGLASGLLNTTGQVGGALGLAVLATLAGARTLSLAHDGGSATAALAGGYHLAWLVGAGTVVIALVLTISLLRTRTSIEMDVALDEDEAVA